MNDEVNEILNSNVKSNLNNQNQNSNYNLKNPTNLKKEKKKKLFLILAIILITIIITIITTIIIINQPKQKTEIELIQEDLELIVSKLGNYNISYPFKTTITENKLIITYLNEDYIYTISNNEIKTTIKNPFHTEMTLYIFDTIITQNGFKTNEFIHLYNNVENKNDINGLTYKKENEQTTLTLNLDTKINVDLLDTIYFEITDFSNITLNEEEITIEKGNLIFKKTISKNDIYLSIYQKNQLTDISYNSVINLITQISNENLELFKQNFNEIKNTEFNNFTITINEISDIIGYQEIKIKIDR